jgi:hypothetical protein
VSPNLFYFLHRWPISRVCKFGWYELPLTGFPTAFGDDVGSEAGVATVFGAEVVGLNVEFLGGIERDLDGGSGHENIVVLGAVERIIGALRAAAVDGETYAQAIVGKSSAGDQSNETIEAANE